MFEGYYLFFITLDVQDKVRSHVQITEVITNAQIKATLHESPSKRIIFIKVRRLSCWSSCRHWDFDGTLSGSELLFCISGCESYLWLQGFIFIHQSWCFICNFTSLNWLGKLKFLFLGKWTWNGGGGVFWVIKRCASFKTDLYSCIAKAQAPMCLCFWLWCQEN